jgi:chromosome segregation ATPase
MNIPLKFPVTIILIASHIIFSSSAMVASSTAISSYDSYQNILMTVGSSNRQPNEHLQQHYETIAQNLLNAEIMIKTLQSKVTKQDKKIKSQAATIQYLGETEATHQRSLLTLQQNLSAKELALSQSQANENSLRDQNKQYKNLAILGGITTSLAIGFIVAEKYWDKR